MRAILCFAFIAVFTFSQCKKAGPSPDQDQPAEIVSDTTRKTVDPAQEDELLVRFDKGFEKELIRLGIDKLGKEDGRIRYSDVKDIESLVVRPQIKEGIQGLKGIEYFINLKSLTTLYAKPDTLDLSKNTKLEYLHIETGYEIAGERKALKYLNISNCKELRYLNCKSNFLSKLDISQNKKLTELDCSDNYYLHTLDVSANTELQFLRTPDHEGFLRLDVTNNPELRKLICYSRGLEKLDLSRSPELSLLLLGSGKVELTFGDHRKLDTLSLANGDMRSIDFKKTPNILWLQLTGAVTGTDLTPLSKLRNLSYLDAQFSELDVSSNQSLETLSIHKLGQMQLNLTKNTNLRELFGDGWHSIKHLDLRSCTKLQKFILTDSPALTSICVNTLPDGSDTNWRKPIQAEFRLCK